MINNEDNKKDATQVEPSTNKDSHWKSLLDGMRKLEDLYELRELKDIRYPMMIIAVSSAISAVCLIFIAFNQLGILDALRNLVMLSKFFRAAF